MTYKVNSFFCGCGGFDLGFMQAGFDVVGAWDIDKFAVQSYKANLGDHVKQMDIIKMTAGDVPFAAVWLFGFPCQDLSAAGKQAGLFEGNRSKLFFEVMRLLDSVEDKPSIILAENVKQLKKYLPVLKREYAKRGYKMTYVLYNSKYWGVPQNRERYFVIGTKDGTDFEFPEEQHNSILKLSSALEDTIPEKYYVSNDKAAKIIEEAIKKTSLFSDNGALITGKYGQKNGFTPTEISPTLDASAYKGLGCNQERPAVIEILQSVFTTEDGCAYCCDANYAKGTSPGDVGKCRRTHIVEIEVVGMLDMLGHDIVRRVYSPEGLSPTLNTCEGGHRQVKIVEHTPRLRVRKLTPREYFRLQGFPDSYKFVVSNSQLYKQAGNAVTVTVAKAIAERIKTTLDSAY